MDMIRYKAMLTVLAMAMFSLWAGAQDSGIVPEDVMNGNGYSTATHNIIFSWKEPTNSGGMIYGLHVKNTGTSAESDLYYDESGSVLTGAELDAFGIRAKTWGRRSVSVNSEAQAAGKSLPVPPRPVSSAAKASLEEMLLSDVDVAQAGLEDEMELSVPAKGMFRTGVYQSFSVPVQVGPAGSTDGQWTDLPDGGQVWALRITSPGAVGQRLHFPRIDLPEGARLIVYNPDDPQDAYGPFENGEDYWSPTCFAETVVVECHLPAACPARAEKCRRAESTALWFEIDQSVHEYRLGVDVMKSSAGPCHIDVSCEQDWAEIAKGVVGISSLASSGSVWCTGTLLADENATNQIPYLLTASHCISAQSGNYGSNNLEFYWFFGTTVCDTDPPNSPAAFPRSIGGADLLATSPLYWGEINSQPYSTDATLLRLRGAIPEGAVYQGFLTNPLNTEGEAGEGDGAWGVGMDVVGVHHPSGDYKRISFGKTSQSGHVGLLYNPDTGQPYAGSEGYMLLSTGSGYEISWTPGRGVTEPGSSGSALFTADSKQVIGQLFGGWASCEEATQPDYYGRLDVSYQLFQNWMSAEVQQHNVTVNVTGSGRVRIDVVSAMPGKVNAAHYATANEALTISLMDGATFNLVAEAFSGNVFKEWRKDGASLGAGNPLASSSTGDQTFSAIFEEAPAEGVSGEGAATEGDGTEVLCAPGTGGRYGLSDGLALLAAFALLALGAGRHSACRGNE